MPLKLFLASWLWCTVLYHGPGLCVNHQPLPSSISYPQATPSIEPVRLVQILVWISQEWKLEYSIVEFDYQKDLVLISEGPCGTFWKIHYRNACGIVDLADLL